jgi:hypothetical protein
MAAPVAWYCSMRLAQAQAWLSEEQEALKLSSRGVQLWTQVGQHAATQVCVVFFGGGGGEEVGGRGSVLSA